jgi:hypothetical protein
MEGGDERVLSELFEFVPKVHSLSTFPP